MRFEWYENKSRQNLRKHDVRLETAILVFDDPYAITQRDLISDDEEHWITVGAIGPVLFFGCHTFHEKYNKESFASSQLAPPSRTKGAYEKLTKEKRAIRAIAAKRDEDIDFSDVSPILDWSGPKSASSTGRRRSPSPCVWIRRHGMAQSRWPRVSRPKRISFYGMPWFTTRERRT